MTGKGKNLYSFEVFFCVEVTLKAQLLNFFIKKVQKNLRLFKKIQKFA